MNVDLAAIVQRHWGWTGIAVSTVTAISPFGHLVIKDDASIFWYLDPEMRDLKKVATDDSSLLAYFADEDVRMTWEAAALVESARERLGALADGQCYSLKFPALIQGDYASENLCIYPVSELIAVTGDFELQTRDWPDGQKFTLKVID